MVNRFLSGNHLTLLDETNVSMFEYGQMYLRAGVIRPYCA